jgi:hypothetical protein
VGFLDRFKKPKSSVSLTIPKSIFELGEDLKGAITVSCREEFDATEVRAELRCIEKKEKERWVYDSREKRNVRRTYTDKNTLVSVNPKASGALHMLPGFKKTFPIKVNIPAGGVESFYDRKASVTWSIKGVVAIKGRPDVTSETIKLRVIRPAAGPTAVKEREVVMIPCEYCETLMPETATSCPNCGAPRKT